MLRSHCRRNLNHYIPAQLSSEFFRKIDLAMKLKKEELKEQKPKPKQLNEMTEENIMQALQYQ